MSLAFHSHDNGTYPLSHPKILHTTVQTVLFMPKETWVIPGGCHHVGIRLTSRKLLWLWNLSRTSDANRSLFLFLWLQAWFCWRNWNGFSLRESLTFTYWPGPPLRILHQTRTQTSSHILHSVHLKNTNNYCTSVCIHSIWMSTQHLPTERISGWKVHNYMNTHLLFEESHSKRVCYCAT